MQDVAKISEKAVVKNLEEIVGDRGKRKLQMPPKSLVQKHTKSRVKRTNKCLQKNVKPDPCAHGKCQNKCSAHLGGEGQHLFDMYRALGNEGKKSFLLSCIKDKKKRVYTKQQHSRRSRTLTYHLPKEETKIKVCQQFILKTIDISQ
ncbi:hypothetical protein PR048_010200 [Dryococelus australis]|uniref:Uncharacterized protein n=1 Tax=Dryococelus australis TaxID=614101 RepID=A0ABQ9I2X1_9NEOP|nr:hypothetical protein PR048_010200 [Dryococelus australis]